MDELFDFSCWVGSYELRYPDEPDLGMWMLENPIPHLFLTGPAKRVKPKRASVDRLVNVLANLQMPKWERDWADWGAWFDWHTRDDVVKADDFRAPIMPTANFEPDSHEFALLKTIVSSFSKQIGMLHWREAEPPQIGDSECLSKWIGLAWNIQRVFQAPGSPNKPAKVGNLGIFLVNTPNSGTAIRIRPSDTRAAVIYHAARMVAEGTAFQTCAQCQTPYLAGGMRGKKKKRAGSRFCSDQCRWTFNNARLAKRRRR